MKIMIMGMVAVLWLSSALTVAQPGKTYTDSRSKQVFFPLGDRSFADRVVSFKRGKPPAASEYSHPEQALGTPYSGPGALAVEHANAYSLGCGGTLTLQFIDNALVDVAGPDLYVFEAGRNIEPTTLAISKDGKTWVSIGTIAGGTAEIDLANIVNPEEVFYFVRLTDLRTACGPGRHGARGADIDAVGAIGSAKTITLSVSVLFEFDKSALKPEAKNQLNDASREIEQSSGRRILIEGHTDNVGSIAYNLRLSKERARAVREYLVSMEKLQGVTIEAHGYGESRPIASNDTADGREKNRRVEITIIPRTR